MPSMRALVLTSALVVALAAIPVAAFAQQAAPPAAATAAETPATVSDVASLTGDWALNMESPMGPSTSNLTLSVTDGKVVAEIASEMIPKTAITQIFKAGPKLVLKYSVDFQGQAIPVILTLTPKGDGGVTANFDFAGGQFMMDGTGTKKKA
jgi:hypothetical protein